MEENMIKKDNTSILINIINSIFEECSKLYNNRELEFYEIFSLNNNNIIFEKIQQKMKYIEIFNYINSISIKNKLIITSFLNL